MGLNEPCINTAEEEDATHRTPTSLSLKRLCYRKENTFQQRPDPGTLSFALSLTWENFSVTINQGHSTPTLTNPDWEEEISLVPVADTSAASAKGLKIHTL